MSEPTIYLSDADFDEETPPEDGATALVVVDGEGDGLRIVFYSSPDHGTDNAPAIGAVEDAVRDAMDCFAGGRPVMVLIPAGEGRWIDEEEAS